VVWLAGMQCQYNFCISELVDNEWISLHDLEKVKDIFSDRECSLWLMLIFFPYNWQEYVEDPVFRRISMWQWKQESLNGCHYGVNLDLASELCNVSLLLDHEVGITDQLEYRQVEIQLSIPQEVIALSQRDYVLIPSEGVWREGDKRVGCQR